MKYLILVAGLLVSAASFAQVTFKVKGPEKLSGSFKDVKIVRTGNKISAVVVVKSMELSKKDKREDLLDYFDAKDFPTTSFKATIKGEELLGEYILKGKIKKLIGKINGNKATFKIPLTDLVTGFKAMFLSDGDHVEMKMEIK